MTVGPLIRGGKKGAMIDASTRVIGMSVGKMACSMASVSMVNQKSSMCTSSETEYSGQVNCQQRQRGVTTQASKALRTGRGTGFIYTARASTLMFYLYVL